MKKAIKVVVNVFSWVILIFAFIVTLLVFTADRNNGVSSLAGFIPLTVSSNSMTPTFSKNDMIIDREIDDINELVKGDVITFWTMDIIEGQRVKNTHRIVEIKDDNGKKLFVTRGDNNSQDDNYPVYAVDIIGKWTGAKINGFGRVMDYLRTKTGFFIFIIIPMTLFFLFELYKLIIVIVEIKRPELTVEDEEMIKRRAIEEYLAEQKLKENSIDDKADKEDNKE